MREKTLFYIIFSKQNIIYSDEHCKEFFKTKNNFANILQVLNELSLDDKQKEQIIQKIDQNEAFTTKYKKDDIYINIEISPIKRPKGFFAMKGML
jgi:lipid A disaccharide synthetase